MSRWEFLPQQKVGGPGDATAACASVFAARVCECAGRAVCRERYKQCQFVSVNITKWMCVSANSFTFTAVVQLAVC